MSRSGAQAAVLGPALGAALAAVGPAAAQLSEQTFRSDRTGDLADRCATSEGGACSVVVCRGALHAPDLVRRKARQCRCRWEPGFGPRHMLFGKDGKFVYVPGEMASAVAVMFRSDWYGRHHGLEIEIIETHCF